MKKKSLLYGPRSARIVFSDPRCLEVEQLGPLCPGFQGAKIRIHRWPGPTKSMELFSWHMMQHGTGSMAWQAANSTAQHGKHGSLSPGLMAFGPPTSFPGRALPPGAEAQADARKAHGQGNYESAEDEDDCGLYQLGICTCR